MPTANAINANSSGLVRYNGTGTFDSQTTTQYNVLIGNTSNGISNIAPSATSGVPLVSAGAAVNPAFGTAVVAGGGTGKTSLTPINGLMIANSTSAVGITNAGTNGQLLIGSTSAAPAFATVTSTGSTIAFTLGANTLNLEVNSPVTEVTGTSSALVKGNTYIANNAGLVTLTLPTTAALGDTIQIIGKGAGLYVIAQNASQQIFNIATSTTVGVTGTLTAISVSSSLTLRCTTANTGWTVTSASGTFLAA
jgi:hypothetical protein